jgi:hypothetical protein
MHPDGWSPPEVGASSFDEYLEITAKRRGISARYWVREPQRSRQEHHPGGLLRGRTR